MFSGVVLALLASVSIGASYSLKLKHERATVNDATAGTAGADDDKQRPLMLDEAAADHQHRDGDDDGEKRGGIPVPRVPVAGSPEEKRRSRLGLVVTAVGGVLIGLWSPLTTRAQAAGQLSPYVGGVCSVRSVC